MTNEVWGVIQQGRFCPNDGGLLRPRCRLTTQGMNAGTPPEACEIQLQEYEGKEILVQGHRDGEWMYSAYIAKVKEAGTSTDKK